MVLSRGDLCGACGVVVLLCATATVRADMPPSGVSQAGAKSNELGLARVVSIPDLRTLANASATLAAGNDVQRAGLRAPTTADVPFERRAQRVEMPLGVVVETRCTDVGCSDVLIIGGRTVLGPELDRKIQRSGLGKQARAIQVEWLIPPYVSVYVADSWLVYGAAHANNELRCRTFDSTTGRVLSLRDIVSPRGADVLLDKMRRLLRDPELVDSEGLAADLTHAGDYELGPLDFRLTRTEGYHHEQPEIVLCATRRLTGSDGTLLELRVQAVPVSYLLR